MPLRVIGIANCMLLIVKGAPSRGDGPAPDFITGRFDDLLAFGQIYKYFVSLQWNPRVSLSNQTRGFSLFAVCILRPRCAGIYLRRAPPSSRGRGGRPGLLTPHSR